MNRVTAVVVSWLAGPAWSQAEAPVQAPSAAGGNLLAMTGALLLVVVLIFVLGWVVKNFMHGRITGRGGQSLKVVEQLAVGARERLVVVEFGHRRLLLGMVPGRISRLDSVELDEITAPDDSSVHRADRNTVSGARQ